jgi:hypothetical protein
LLFNEKLYVKKRARIGSGMNGFSVNKKVPLLVYHVEDTKERKEDLE